MTASRPPTSAPPTSPPSTGAAGMDATPATATMHGLTFHPRFATRGADSAILQSSSKVCFYYSLPVLAAKSSFFDGMATLPLPDTDEDDPSPGIMPFDRLSTPALAFALDSVTWVKPPRGVPARPPVLAPYDEPGSPGSHGKINTHVIDELLEAADAFDLPLHTALFEALKASHWPAGVCLAVSVLTGKGDKSYWATKVLCEGGLEDGLESRLPPGGQWAREHLFRANQHMLTELSQVSGRWRRALTNFHAESRTMPDGKDGFGNSCTPLLPVSHPVRTKCASYAQFNGDWAKFRDAALASTWKEVEANPAHAIAVVPAAARKAAKCPRCAVRIEHAVAHAWKTHIKRGDWVLPGMLGVRKQQTQPYSRRRR